MGWTMKRKGFVSIVALLIMTVTLISATYMMYIFILQTNISRNSQEDIQSRISSDDKINRLIFDMDNFEDIILPEIYYLLRNRNPPFMIDYNSNRDPINRKFSIPKDSDLADNITSSALRLQASNKILQMAEDKVPANFDESTGLVISIETEYGNKKRTLEAKGKIIHQIFEIKEPYICEDKMEAYNLLDDFNDLMNLIENDIFDHDPKGTSSAISMNFDGNVLVDGNYISGLLNNRSSFHGYTGKHVFINIKDLGEDRPILEIKDEKNTNKLIKLRGNIYCEGDIIISSPLELEGNLILNNGTLTLNTNKKPLVKGKVLYRGDGGLNIDDISLKSEKRYIYRFGSYIPGFIDMEIDVIKK